MKSTFNQILCAVAVFAATFSSCKKSDNGSTTTEETEHQYGLYVRAGTPSGDYLISVSSLDSGTATLTGNGAEVTSAMNYATFAKNGYYYCLKNSALSKYTLANNTLTTVASIPFSLMTTLNSPIWVDDNTLLALSSGTDTDGTVQLTYAVINTSGNSLSVTTSGQLALTTTPEGYETFELQGYQLNNGKLYIEYSYDNGWSATTASGSYVASLDYPAMTNITVDHDTRTTSPGGTLGYQPFQFVDESGDIYILNTPGVRIGNYPSMATAVTRVKSGATTFDQSYFFDISAAAGQHAYGMWYLGNGKALIKTERSSLISTWADYSKYVFDFYVVDLSAKTATHLDVPLHAGAYLANVVVKDGIAYIANENEAGNSAVYIYNSATEKLTTGLKLQDGLTYVLRIDQIK